MAHTRQIILNNVSYKLPNTTVCFNDVNFAFNQSTYGIVGKNGVGKTTFLRLLLGALQADSGSIMLPEVQYVQQNHSEIPESATISDALGVSQLLSALVRVEQGSTDEKDYDLLTDNWDVHARVQATLEKFMLWPVDLTQPFHHLSGGQKTKVLLARAFIFKADFYLFDEPTNNLDCQTKAILLQTIDELSAGVIVVSHDRALLNQCDCIIELTSKGIMSYGGNYDFYHEQKTMQQAALEHKLKTQTDKLNNTMKQVQSRLEKHAQCASQGNHQKKQQIKAKGQYNKIEMNAKKGRSESSNKRIRQQADKQITALENELQSAKEEIEVDKSFNVSLAHTKVPSNKNILEISQLYFSYGQESLLENINLSIIGPERIALAGPNGCGKSTLIELIRGILKPHHGKVKLGAANYVYLDQQVSFLNPELTLVDNYLKLNPKASSNDAYKSLAAFKFRNKAAQQLAEALSGGEKMRAGLAISLMSQIPPQLIILDEPTNHLDLEAIEAMEMALNAYQGAIIAVSHDNVFLENINIEKHISI